MPSEYPVDEVLRRLAERLTIAVDDLDGVARYVKKSVFVAELKEAVKDGVAKALSPWLNPSTAAAHSHSCEGHVALMAKIGVIKRYGSEHKPIYAKAEIDAAIRENRWSSKKKKRRS